MAGLDRCLGMDTFGNDPIPEPDHALVDAYWLASSSHEGDTCAFCMHLRKTDARAVGRTTAERAAVPWVVPTGLPPRRSECAE